MEDSQHRGIIIPEPPWKRHLRAQFEKQLAALEDAPDDLVLVLEEDLEETDPPDIYQYYEQLAAISNEFRKGNRRTAEVFTQFGDSLGGLDGELQQLRRHLHAVGEKSNAQAEGVPRKYCLALLELEDRLERLRRQLESPPAPKSTFFSRPSSEWPEAWASIRQAIEILTDHLAALLNQLGVQAIEVMARSFDPTYMKAIAREERTGVAPSTVIEEVTRGYLYQGEPLRLAEVKVSSTSAS